MAPHTEVPELKAIEQPDDGTHLRTRTRYDKDKYDYVLHYADAMDF